jgi:hypothetical protein
MSNPDTRYSDNTALAIASLGNFEVIIGCERAHQTHMRGVACIKDVRGGSMHWVLDGILSWMINMKRQQIMRGTFVILGSTTAT